MDVSRAGSSFHHSGLGGLGGPDSSPPQYARPVQIICANCHRPSILKESYACAECIGGFCAECVYVLNGKACPRCRADAARFKQLQLELRQ